VLNAPGSSFSVTEVIHEYLGYIDTASRPEDVDGWLRLYAEAAAQADIADEVATAKQAIESGTLPSAAMVDLIERAEKRYRDRTATARPGVDMGDVMTRMFATIRATVEGGNPEGVPLRSCLGPVTSLLGGYYPGTTVIAGRPKQGKSTLMEQEMLWQAGKGRASLLCSLEMAEERVGIRLASRISGQCVSYVC